MHQILLVNHRESILVMLIYKLCVALIEGFLFVHVYFCLTRWLFVTCKEGYSVSLKGAFCFLKIGLLFLCACITFRGMLCTSKEEFLLPLKRVMLVQVVALSLKAR